MTITSVASTGSLDALITALHPPRCGYATVHGGGKIYYEVYGEKGDGSDAADARPRLLLIMGLACTSKAWRWQLADLLAVQDVQALGDEGGGETALRACVLDNRGVGLSVTPKDKKAYSTTIMAQDALTVMDEIGWSTAHVVGFSMGGMIACKLAAAAPKRVLSMTLISSTGGGLDSLPRSFKGYLLHLRQMIRKDADSRADADLYFHFTLHTLKHFVRGQGCTRRDLLHREYVVEGAANSNKRDSDVSDAGMKGQLHACWVHRVTDSDVQTIRAAKFPLLAMHGRHDTLASPLCGDKLAARLGAACVMLEGAHFVPRECAPQVNALLRQTVLAQLLPPVCLDNAPHLDPHFAVDLAALPNKRTRKRKHKGSDPHITALNGEPAQIL